MADEGIKKTIITKEELPSLVKLGEDEYGHLLRYRIISEDKNRFSHWSKITPVTLFSADSLPPQVIGELTLSGLSASGIPVTVIWDDELNRPKYDIFVSFDDDDFFYHGTSPIHTYSLIAPATAFSIAVAIQIESIVKERSEVLTICELDAIIDLDIVS
jgi:hypothetical protein